MKPYRSFRDERGRTRHVDANNNEIPQPKPAPSVKDFNPPLDPFEVKQSEERQAKRVAEEQRYQDNKRREAVAKELRIHHDRQIVQQFHAAEIGRLFEGDYELETECITRMRRDWPNALGEPSAWSLVRDTVLAEREARGRFNCLPMKEIRKSTVAQIASKIGTSLGFAKQLVSEISAAESVTVFKRTGGTNGF